MKIYTIFAGVNGAGKSTLYNIEIIKNNDLGKRINTDEIVKEIGEWKNSSDQIKAARIGIKWRNEYIEKDISFNQETTLTGNTVLKGILKAKERGFKIYLHYIGVKDVEIAKERVRIRVKNGGHGIPDKDIEKRYIESFENLKKIFKICDKITVYDNSDYIKECLLVENGNIIWSENIPKWLENIIKYI